MEHIYLSDGLFLIGFWRKKNVLFIFALLIVFSDVFSFLGKAISRSRFMLKSQKNNWWKYVELINYVKHAKRTSIFEREKIVKHSLLMQVIIAFRQPKNEERKILNTIFFPFHFILFGINLIMHILSGFFFFGFFHYYY